MAAFTPVGDRARWRIVYDLIVETETGDVVTYGALAEVLDLDAGRDRHAIQMAVRRAAREHEEQDKRALEAVPNEGYRVVLASEQLRLARRFQRKASNALVLGQSKAVNVNLAGLEPETRHAFEVVARAFAMQLDFNRRLEGRQEQVEQALSEITDRASRTAEEVTELRERLARLENPERP